MSSSADSARTGSSVADANSGSQFSSNSAIASASPSRTSVVVREAFEESPLEDSEKIIPPFRFALLAEGLYRGAYPTSRNFRHLRRLKLRTVVSLIPLKPTEELVQFCAEERIQMRVVNVSKFKGELTLSNSLVKEVLEIIIDAKHHPLYLHCLDGGNNTGMMVACLRKLQNWHTSVIHAEFSRFIRPKTGLISASEVDFIEQFQNSIRVPPVTPTWLWGGLRPVKHPSIQLLFEDLPASSATVSPTPATAPAVRSAPPQSAANSTASRTVDALDIAASPAGVLHTLQLIAAQHPTAAARTQSLSSAPVRATNTAASSASASLSPPPAAVLQSTSAKLPRVSAAPAKR